MSVLLLVTAMARAAPTSLEPQVPPSSATAGTLLTAAPTNTAPPIISGDRAQGATLTASTGGWTGSPTGYSYQWEGCPASGGTCAAISSARTTTVDASVTLKLAMSPAHPAAEQKTKLTVTVSSSSSNLTPDGTVTITRGAKKLTRCAKLPVSGKDQTVTVTCSTRLHAGTGTLRAQFTPAGGAPLATPAPAERAVAVPRAPTSVTLVAPFRARPGAKLSYSASVSSDSGAAPAGGHIVFLDHGRPIAGCVKLALRKGSAVCNLSYALPATHVITARYSGGTNYSGSTSAATHEKIARPKARGAVTATMRWTFHFTPRYTSINALVLHGVRSESTVIMRCSGRGCPFRASRRVIRHGGRPIDLTSRFRHRHLRVHARVVIEITHAGDVGKYYRFVIRARKQPKILISCLALGSKRPGVGCTRS